jgi:hypothetical protein
LLIIWNYLWLKHPKWKPSDCSLPFLVEWR